MSSAARRRRQAYSQTELDVISAVPLDLEHVPDEETERFDARLRSQAKATNETRIRGRLALDGQTPIEIKTCQLWTKAGSGSNGSRRRGRWQIGRDAHEYLVENGGAYLLAVLDDDVVLAYVLVLAVDLEPKLDGRWVSGTRREYVVQLNRREIFDDWELNHE